MTADWPRPADGPGGATERLGPLPPRISTSATSGPPMAPPASPLPPPSGPPGYPPTSAVPAYGPVPGTGAPPYATQAPVPSGPQRRRGGRLGAVAFVLVLLLLLVSGGQGYVLYQMNQKLDAANRAVA